MVLCHMGLKIRAAGEKDSKQRSGVDKITF